MVFTNTWDETTPTDGSLAAQGDDEIRKIKAALTERLTQVLLGWSSTDPLKLLSSALDIGVLSIGTDAAKPNPATSYFYYASDSAKFYAKDGTTYTAITLGSGGGSTSNISYESLRRKTVTVTQAIAAVPVGALGTGNFIDLVVEDATYGMYVVLDIRARVKKAITGAFADLGTRQTGEFLQDGPAGDNLGVRVNGITEEQDGTDLKFVADVWVGNTNGAPTDVTVEVILYLLCIDSDSPAD